MVICRQERKFSLINLYMAVFHVRSCPLMQGSIFDFDETGWSYSPVWEAKTPYIFSARPPGAELAAILISASRLHSSTVRACNLFLLMKRSKGLSWLDSKWPGPDFLSSELSRNFDMLKAKIAASDFYLEKRWMYTSIFL